MLVNCRRQPYEFTADINITYSSPRGDDLDTRLLRAMVIKGILEEITTANVNMVNADLLAENRGLRITETSMKSEGSSVLTDMSVAISTSKSKFSGCVDQTGRIYVQVSTILHWTIFHGDVFLS